MSDGELSDLDVDSPTNLNGLDNSKRHARAQHNALERRRRDNIKDMYKSLREEIPNFANSERASRAQILRKTIEQITEQNNTVQELEGGLRQLQQSNDELARQVLQRELALARGAGVVGIPSTTGSVAPTVAEQASQQNNIQK